MIGFGYEKNQGLVDILGVQINPATEDKQDDIISALGGIAPASTIDDGTVSVTTAGTRVQLSNVACKKVLIQCHESNGSLGNGGSITVGGSNVVAALGSRRGYTIYPTQSQMFEVSNLNKLYIDALDNGAKINYIYFN